MELFVQWIYNVFACAKHTRESIVPRNHNGILYTQDLQWIFVYKDVRMDSFVKQHHNGIFSTDDLQWILLSVADRAHLIANYYIITFVKGIAMESFV